MTTDKLDLGELRGEYQHTVNAAQPDPPSTVLALLVLKRARDGLSLIARVEAAEKLIGQADGIIERMVSRGIDAEKLQEELKRAAFSHACMPDMVVRGMAAQVQIKDYRRLIVRLVEATPDGMCFDAAAFDEAERIARSTLPTEAT